ncbi:UNVERIFIED_CONTAM: hypothetical protein Sradi_3605300 [Sesamum radiatum]|uniref:Uncharacterized protein n=1 Tax=Sesamum radiatum TaxID=300843 RepID=A0AAW2QGZ0_SESRA
MERGMTPQVESGQAEQPLSLSSALAEVPIIFEPGQVSSTEIRKPIRKFVTKPKSAGQKRKLPAYLSSPQSKKVQSSNSTAVVAAQPRREP